MLGLSFKAKTKQQAPLDLRDGFIAFTDLRDGPTLDAWRHWESLRSGRAMPEPGDLDPIAIPKLLRHSIIVDVHPDPLNFIYTIVGQEFVDTFHVNPRGKSIAEFSKSPNVFARAFIDVYIQVYNTRTPAAYRGTSGSLGLSLCRESVWLPFSSDGASVKWIWCAFRFDMMKDPA